MRRRMFVYVLASRTRRLYIGVTNDLRRRLAEHRSATDSFAAGYRITRLVHFEEYDSPMKAIRREKQLKGWLRKKKLALVTASNPQWIDLSGAWETEAANAAALAPRGPGGGPSLRSG